MDQTTQAWLELQCHYIEQTVNGVVLLGPPGVGPYDVMAHWPQDKATSATLKDFSQKLLDNNQQKVTYRIDRGGRFTVVACPVIVGGLCFGIITLMIKGADKECARKAGELLEWGCEWFSWLAKERKHTREKDGRLVGFVEILAFSLKYEDLQRSAQLVVDSLKGRMACGRVSLGLVENHHIKVIAVSEMISATERISVESPIRNAMEESIDQSSTLMLNNTSDTTGEGEAGSDTSGGQLSHAHRHLLNEHKINSVCTIPMIHNEVVIGALTLEELKGDTIDDTSLRFCEQVALLVGPIVRLKSHGGVKASLRQKFTQGSQLLKAGVALFFALLLSLFFIEGEYQISATATLESRQKQSLSAAQDGFIALANVKPGDRVVQGQVLASLDDRDLKLEQKKWQSKRAQLIKAYNSALGSHDRVQVNVLKAQLKQASAELALLENQLNRLSLKTPFDGVVLSGDLSQSLGAPVQRGEVLYEVAMLDDYHLLLQVDERDIVDLHEGQQGKALLSSLPKLPLSFSVSSITPIASTAEGKVFFQVKARLIDKSVLLNPGMTGIAKVDAGQRPLAWIWFHRVYHWFGLWLWRI